LNAVKMRKFMITTEESEQIASILKLAPFNQIKPISGGSINEAFVLSNDSDKVFVKRNNKDQYPQMFVEEANGLNLLRENARIMRIPEVLAVFEMGSYQYLALEFIQEGQNTQVSQQRLGHALAEIHTATASVFGHNENNYMGALPQSNRDHQDWVEFWTEERLRPQVNLAIDRAAFTAKDASDFELLYKNLPNLMPREEPCLVHGDLWSGNYLINYQENPVLIDPAVYFGHREVDIAMTQLFGGFSEQFYTAYHEALPLESGWKNRTDLFNLYPLLIHVNLFGGGYIQQVKSIIKNWV